jgi:hypothetical protein
MCPSVRPSTHPSLGVFILFVLATGCAGPNAPLTAPEYDPDAMADAALKQFDGNGNGTIEGVELNACPALKAAMPAIDKNKDKAISRDELVERFRSYKEAGVGAVSVSCTVRLNGQPLEGATVTFVPEDCMKGTVKGGSGATDAEGVAQVKGEGGLPGLPLGLYRVTVSKSSGGSEQIPARYNAQTTLGAEIATGSRGTGSIEFNLTSP